MSWIDKHADALGVATGLGIMVVLPLVLFALACLGVFN